VLKFRFVTLLVFLATLALSVYLFVIIPKDFFPQQDTGLITGIAETGQDISFTAMMRSQEVLGRIVLNDQAVTQCPSADPATRSILAGSLSL
jgi:hydrophobic/amphiphilic exporter-1 (mainly G- bacteria), HAE1 family